MEISSAPARLPSRICTSTSLPPAMICASGCSSRSATAFSTLAASYKAFISYMAYLPSFSFQLSWIKPALVNSANSTWGVMGMVSTATPVAL